MAKKTKTRIYKVYKYKNIDYVKINGLAWSLYTYRSSKKIAKNSIHIVKRDFGRDNTSSMRIVRANRDGELKWGIFQLSPKPEYQTKADVLTTLAKKTDSIY